MNKKTWFCYMTYNEVFLFVDFKKLYLHLAASDLEDSA